MPTQFRRQHGPATSVPQASPLDQFPQVTHLSPLQSTVVVAQVPTTDDAEGLR